MSTETRWETVLDERHNWGQWLHRALVEPLRSLEDDPSKVTDATPVLKFGLLGSYPNLSLLPTSGDKVFCPCSGRELERRVCGGDKVPFTETHPLTLPPRDPSSPISPLVNKTDLLFLLADGRRKCFSFCLFFFFDIGQKKKKN